MDVIAGVLDEVRALQVEQSGDQGKREREQVQAITTLDREIANLTASLRVLRPSADLVIEMRACQTRKTAIERAQRDHLACERVD